MAPASKQSLLPINSFIKNPKKSTVKTHKKFEVKNGLVKEPAKTKKPRIDKNEQKRIKEEKAIQEGGRQWREYMDIKGFVDVERHDPCMLFQVYGPPPDPEAESSSEEENDVGLVYE